MSALHIDTYVNEHNTQLIQWTLQLAHRIQLQWNSYQKVLPFLPNHGLMENVVIHHTSPIPQMHLSFSVLRSFVTKISLERLKETTASWFKIIGTRYPLICHYMEYNLLIRSLLEATFC